MSKIERYAGNVRAFASEAQGIERTTFGETTQADDLTSQVTASFLRGWGIVGPSEHPSLEDFNAAMYAMSQFIAYQHQIGVAEWHAEQEYYLGSICTHAGVSYQSLENGNVGNEPPSTKWTPLLTSNNGFSNLGLGNVSRRDVGIETGQIPDISFFAALKAAGGYQKIPGGLIIQWGSNIAGTGGTGGTGTTVNFPIPFPSACAQIVTSYDNGSTQVIAGGAQPVDTSTFKLRCSATSGSFVFRWIAIGY